jgi:quercetin dioxygenase-like cupin family protein
MREGSTRTALIKFGSKRFPIDTCLREISMRDALMKNPSRRSFLRAAPAAAAAGLALSDASFFAAPATAQDAAGSGAPTFQLFSAQQIQADVKALQESPGNNNLIQWKNFTVVLTTETAKSGKEFEWHEGRDHIFQILDGSTVYELGGEPQGGRNIRAGEWLAPASQGATTLTLHKGDMLVIPRGTPHRRSTTGSVTFTLISPQGTAS